MGITIRNCTFAYRCDRKWAELTKSDNPDVRFCNECQKNVYFCRSDDELAEAVKQDRCVAIERSSDQLEVTVPTMGVIELKLRKD